MKFKALVLVSLRPNVSDAAGNAVSANVPRVCDINEISKLRLGKAIDFHFEAPDREHAERELRKVSDQLFANTVIEDWEYTLEEVK